MGVSNGLSSNSSSFLNSRVKIGPKVNQKIWEKFKKAAKIMGVDVQKLLDKAMEEYLENHRNEIEEKARKLVKEVID